MGKLFLSNDEMAVLENTLSKLEKENGDEYSFKPEVSAFSCKCSGPAQSCTWH